MKQYIFNVVDRELERRLSLVFKVEKIITTAKSLMRGWLNDFGALLMGLQDDAEDCAHLRWIRETRKQKGNQ